MTDEWTWPKHFHGWAEQSAYRSAARVRAEVHREEEWGWTIVPKASRSSVSTKRAGVKEMHTFLPRGSVLQQNVTKLAAVATRSIAVQTEDPA